jgi:hypothetical protein
MRQPHAIAGALVRTRAFPFADKTRAADACRDRVTQRFAETWVLAKRAGRWTATALFE